MSRYLFCLLGVFAMSAAAAAPPVGPLPAGAPMFYTAGNDVGMQPIMPPGMKALTPAELADAVANRAAIAHREGLTAHEPYVKWWLCEPEPGKWDFSYYDVHAKAAHDAVFAGAAPANRMRWLPFLIAGPAYATPPWFKNSGESLFARCLEHDQETKTQSIWNPKLRPHVEEFLRRFAGHFAAQDIESVLLGISGDFGESIYTAGGNVWTYLDDPYHVHAGYWCGDPQARAHFREAMRRRYRTLAALNKAWGTHHASFEEVQPFLPDAAPNRRARLDMQRWYCAAMTDWADFWLAAARRAFPKSRILLCTGGDGSSMLGGDFSAQAEAAARHHAGIRITNEATDYASNYMLTRHVATSCRQYGTHFGFEPAGAVALEGIVGRIYNATASGADELFTYDPEPAGECAERYAAWRRFLVKREPLVDAGYFLNRTSADLGVNAGYWEAGRALRSATDFDIVDERLIAAGALKRLRVLFWAAGPVVEVETARAIESWVRRGGILVVDGLDGIETVEGSPAPAEVLLPALPEPPAGQRTAVRLDIGTARGDRALRGEWNGPERGMFPAPDATFRWSTAGSAIEVPLPQGEKVTLAVCLCAGGPRPADQAVAVGGQVVARAPGAGVHILRAVLAPEQLSGRKSIRVEFPGPTWQPAAQPPGDTRHLGVAVAWVAALAGDVPADRLSAQSAAPAPTLEQIAKEHTRRLGKGCVVWVPEGGLLLPALAHAVLYQPGRFLPGARAPYPPLEGDTEGVFLTRFRDGSALLLNFTGRPAAVRYGGHEVTLPARGIGEVARGG